MLQQLTHLRVSALRYYPEFIDCRRSFDMTRQFVHDRIRSSTSLTWFRHRRRYRAAWLESLEDNPHFGTPVTLVLLLADPADDAAMDWLRSEAQRRRGCFATNTELLLDLPYEGLLSDLVGVGLHVESVILHGCPTKALDMLGRDRPDFRRHDLECRRLTDVSTVDAILELQERLFRANPEYGWFVALPGHLQAKQDELFQELQDGSPFRFVLARNHKVLGTFAFTPVFDHPCWGTIASVEVMLDPEIQGRGVGRDAYREMLHAMEAAHISVFRGGTSHPAVLRLSERMGREVRAWEIRAGEPAFAHDHFRFPKRG